MTRGDDRAAVLAVEAQFYDAMRRLHRDPAALGELLAVWSQGDDVSTMNARGGVERGWEAVRDRWTWWASQGVPMEAERIEHLAFAAGAEIAYSVALEHHATRTLRVTHGYRREGDAWKLAHRHADPLVGRQG
ncbi:MAG: nuclear transport factor 2 family protein [Thermomicrobiales bacterium]